MADVILWGNQAQFDERTREGRPFPFLRILPPVEDGNALPCVRKRDL